MCIFVLQDKRISCADALTHPYMDEGRLRYHSCMCRCCQNTPAGRQYVADFEPVSPHIFDDCFEKDLTSVHQVKGKLFFVPTLVELLYKNDIDDSENITYDKLNIIFRISFHM